MKIAWFSPMPPDATDIANFTVRILPFLKAEFQVEVFTEQESRFSHGSSNWRELNQFDFPVYNIGNNVLYHRNIWETSVKHPGIVILHDEALQDFFAMLYKSEKDRTGYLDQMKFYYGDKGHIYAGQYWNGSRIIDDMINHFPLTDLGLKGATGVVVHTENLFEKIKARNTFPVAYLKLPYNSAAQERLKDVGQEKPYSLIVFGHLGRNRRLESILHALAVFPQSNDFKLSIIGELWNKDRILKLVNELEIQDQVEIFGYMPEVELDSRLAHADLAFNLRYPTMGEASGSQLRIWDQALPSLVTKTGWYEEQPDNTVFMVDPDHECEDIHRYLRLFLDNPAQFRKVGENGRKYLLSEHTPSQYVQGLKEFLGQAEQWRGKSCCKYFAGRVAGIFSEHVNESNVSLLQNIAQSIRGLT